MDTRIEKTTIIDHLREGALYLAERGVDDPRTEADLLLAHSLRISRDRLYLEREGTLTSIQADRFMELLEQRGKREPLAYLVKTREFMGLDFYVDRRVLIPRPETEMLIEKLIELAEKRAGKDKEYSLLDLGTGSGVMAIAAARYIAGVKITAVDISEDALTVARQNAVKHGVEIDFRQGDLFTPVANQKFDWILTNPPYVSLPEMEDCSPEVLREPHLALCGGEDGLEIYRRLAAQAGDFLHPGGKLLAEIGSAQAPAVCKLFAEKGYSTKVFNDLAGLNRMILVEG
ncbi:protein-(glutamine-N5) methyltransferase, release factor-specific [Syntrophobotulus glycolicus DSM 8271]|uniref:Release factor glutamine methyltransferase n=1 Tax=Syntrophobotulus glycolicus (strain DSM 8271 / FlGlyR) TaxID=645991 RepID=F0T2C3_SYNGF|nr:peptide chain release factor N(5)-glutamine methyltransferase [Syntrophobotulus glycolicus]ADY57551.1 protein-(glutamine-N5) methyltransferase, release factor-specific [Syntrophobotulus glycolicus DSM 8271]